MKICLVSMSTVRLSGIGRTVLNVATELEKQGHTVGFMAEYGDCAGNVCWVQFRSRNPFRILFDICHMVIFSRKYDMLLCYDVLPAGFATAIVSYIARKPLYIHCIGTYSLFPKNSFLKSYVMTCVYAYAHKIFVLSNSVRENIERGRKGFSLKDAVLISPGVEVNFFKQVEEKSLLVQEPYIITVGGVKSRKGHDVSIEAFAQLAEVYPNLKYVIIGDYDTATDFAKQLNIIIDRYDIRGRVIFLEHINDEELRKLYSHAQFFVMTSRTTNEFIEGFGIVYLEAALCGITSIGAYDTGAEDAIIHQETGLLTTLDVSEVARSMELLLTEPEYAKKLGQKAKENAHTYAWSKIAEKYLEYINH